MRPSVRGGIRRLCVSLAATAIPHSELTDAAASVRVSTTKAAMINAQRGSKGPFIKMSATSRRSNSCIAGKGALGASRANVKQVQQAVALEKTHKCFNNNSEP